MTVEINSYSDAISAMADAVEKVRLAVYHNEPDEIIAAAKNLVEVAAAADEFCVISSKR